MLNSESHQVPAIPLTNTPLPQPAPAGDDKLVGVKGWLRFLCVVLTVINPLIAGGQWSQAQRDMPQLVAKYPGLETVMNLETGCVFLLMILSIRAGMRLYRLHPQAVNTARRYFYVVLLYQPLTVAMPYLADLPAPVRDAMASAMATGAVKGVMAAGIWLAYLGVSKRVKATYPRRAG